MYLTYVNMTMCKGKDRDDNDKEEFNRNRKGKRLDRIGSLLQQCSSSSSSTLKLLTFPKNHSDTFHVAMTNNNDENKKNNTMQPCGRHIVSFVKPQQLYDASSFTQKHQENMKKKIRTIR